MRFTPHKITLALAAGFAILALMAPVASAATAEQFLGSRSSHEVATARTVPVAAPNPGFSWGSAALGAGAAGVLALISMTAVAASARRGIRAAR